MPRVSLLDFSFLFFESQQTPMHVIGLVVLDPPKEHKHHYAQDLYAALLQETEVSAPFNWRLQWSITGKPSWQQLKSVNLDDHLRITMLPSPGTEEQLQKVVGRIHGQTLDRSKPMWEVWIIGGLQDDKVALVLKIHHSMADGIKASSIFNRSCGLTPEESFNKPMWQFDLTKTAKERAQEKHLADLVTKAATQATRQLSLIPSMFRLGSKLALKALNIADCDLKLPFTAPKTILNLSPKRSRAVSTGKFSFAQLNHIRSITGASVNDVLFAISDQALNRYLNDRAVPLRKPLVAMMPINLRKEGDGSKSNRMSIGHVELGKRDLTVLERLETIQRATVDLKNEALNISPDAYVNYSFLVNGVSLISGKFGLNSFVPPASNLLISNVPGQKDTAYFMGAKVDAQYPVSLLMPGQTLNITFYSYAGILHYSLVACNQSLPGFEDIGSYMQEALGDLEAEVMDVAIDAVGEQVSFHDEESLALEMAVVAARESLRPTDSAFDVIYQQKMQRVEELERQLAQLTAALENTIKLDPKLVAVNDEDVKKKVAKPRKQTKKKVELSA
ncbi:TPA: wax ester/triacylglycerol synthase family O-acyltransferase [Photobacterium damselae]